MEYTLKPLRARLAAYIATSARRIRASASSACWGKIDADAAVDVDRLVVDGEGCVHRLEELFRDHDGARHIRRAPGDHRKLVAAVSGDRVGLAKHASHPLSDLLQHPIAGLVAEAVVDAFETVKVEEKHSDGFQLPLARPDRLF